MNDFTDTHFYEGTHRRLFKTAKRDKGFADEMASFIQAVEQGRPPVIPFDQIEAVTRTCLLAVRSL